MAAKGRSPAAATICSAATWAWRKSSASDPSTKVSSSASTWQRSGPTTGSAPSARVAATNSCVRSTSSSRAAARAAASAQPRGRGRGGARRDPRGKCARCTAELPLPCRRPAAPPPCRSRSCSSATVAVAEAPPPPPAAPLLAAADDPAGRRAARAGVAAVPSPRASSTASRWHPHEGAHRQGVQRQGPHPQASRPAP